MPFVNTNDYLSGRRPIPTPQGSEIVACRFTIDLPVSDLQVNDCGAVGILPAGCVPVNVYVDMTDIDAGAAAVVFQVGIVNAAEDNISTAAADGGGHWGVTTAVNVAALQRLTFNAKAMFDVMPSAVDRRVGLRVATAPTTPVAGTIGLTLMYRAAN